MSVESDRRDREWESKSELEDQRNRARYSLFKREEVILMLRYLADLSSTGLGNSCYKFQSERHELPALQGHRGYWKYRTVTSGADQLGDIADMKPWVQSPARYNLGMVAQAYNPSTWEVEQEDCEFRIIHSGAEGGVSVGRVLDL